MPRIRTIKPEFWQNEELASLSHHARLLAIALLNYADDEGYFQANTALVRAACFPFEEDSRSVQGSLQELSGIGYVEVRNCSGKAIGKVCKFRSHQRIEKAQKSKLIEVFANAKPADYQENTGENSNSTTVPGTIHDDSVNGHGLEGNGKGMEEEEERNRNAGSCVVETTPQQAAATRSEEVTEFGFVVCNGSEWFLPKSKFEEYRQTFPELDLPTEFRKACQWTRDNPKKRKTAKGMPAFLGNWLSREQNRPKVGQSSTAAKGNAQQFWAGVFKK